MTDEQKPTDYAELLSRAENETHRSNMWSDTCLLIDELSDAIRALMAEMDAHKLIADEIVREVAELPDRTSPEDPPLSSSTQFTR